MKKERSSFLDIIIRYSILILAGIPNLLIAGVPDVWLFYLIFTPLTIYPVYFLLSLFFDVSLVGNFLIIERFFPIEIIGPCVAGSAYYLLLILNLSTPDINIKKRLLITLVSFSSLLLVNILRIFFLAVLFLSGFSYFDIAHELFWYLGSVVFVVGIWFLCVKLFKVKQIPVYSDIISLKKLSGKKLKKSKSSKKN